MKKNILNLFFSISFCFICAHCSSSKKTTYVFDDDMLAKADSFKILCDKGKEIYKAHCTGCHGIFTKGKDGVPNFTKRQLDLYGAKAQLKDPENHAAIQNMPPEQMELLQMFLIYRKRD
jgi:mono/diheme cytochrome c family protein